MLSCTQKGGGSDGAQKGKLFRFGRAIRVLLAVIVIVTGLSALVTFWDALSCVLRPADEVVYGTELQRLSDETL